MCTALAFRTPALYFGRTLDYDCTPGEQVTLTPRRFPFRLRHLPSLETHYALFGIAHVSDGYPLYYDAVNECGLCMAGLRFPDYSVYAPMPDRECVASFELIPYLLGTCANLSEAKGKLSCLCVTDDPFSDTLPPAPLHWLIADREGSLVVESRADGLHLLDDPANTLTNAPPFEAQLRSLADHAQLSPRTPTNAILPGIELPLYSCGMGAMGLPGDLSSQSRFVRAAYTCAHARPGSENAENVTQFFHILNTVEQVRGCCEISPGEYEQTLYTVCYATADCTLYYSTYENRRITAVSFDSAAADGERLLRTSLHRHADFDQDVLR